MFSGSNSLAVVYNSSGIFTKKNSSFGANKRCFDMHWHDRMEFIIIHKGSINIDFGNRQAVVTAGSVIIIPPKQAHSATAMEKGVTYTSVSFDLRFFYNQTAVCTNLVPLIFDGKVQFEVFTKSREIYDLVFGISEESDKSIDQLVTVGEIYKLLSVVINKCAVEVMDDSEESNVFADIIEYIKANYQSNITTAELCKTFGYAKPYFCRRFKEHTGVSPMMYIKSLKLEAACDMLKKKNKSIGDISVACGFGDPNYFARCFKAQFGVSPAQYRKNSKPHL